MKMFRMPAVAIPLLALLASCVDSGYDLDNVDTTVRVDVKDLVLPVNLDPVELKSLFDIDEDSFIKEVDGQYVIEREGEFSSDNIRLNAFTIDGPQPAPTSVQIPFPGWSTFQISTPPADFQVNAWGITSSIVGLSRVTTEGTMTIGLTVDAGREASYRLSNAVYQFPKGLALESADGVYDPATGFFRLSDRTFGGTLSIPVSIKGLEFGPEAASFNLADHSVSYSGKFYLRGADITASPAGASSQTPQSVTIGSTCAFTPIEVKTIDGYISHPIEGVSISNVEFNDLPDILAQAGTDLRMVNPRIYLSVFNPMQRENLYASSGLIIEAVRNDEVSAVFTPDNPVFSTGLGHADAIYNFCLAPRFEPWPAYPDAEFVPFSTLGSVLSGDGMPQRLQVRLDNPCLPRQQVSGLRLGQDLGSATGHYSFVSLLEFAAGSQVIYTETENGWSSETLDHITITALDVTATISSDLPLSLDFTGYPIDAEGNRIGNVEIVGASLAPNAKDQEVHLRITGEIKHLDGLRFTAVARPGADTSALRPDMKITVTRLRPRATGYYLKKL